MFYTRFNRPPNPPYQSDLPSMAIQSARDECDIHFIMARYEKTGTFYPGATPTRTPFYGDVADVPDYQQSMNFIVDAQARFDALPSKLRKRFNHDPAELLDFISNSSNKAEAILLGLLPDDGSANPATVNSP